MKAAGQGARTRSGAQSMTGFGRATTRTLQGSVTVEARSVNHRFLELDVRLPNGFSALHGRVTEAVRGQVRRGRVEVSVFVQTDQLDRRRVVFDERLLERYHAALQDLRRRFGLKAPVTLDHLLALPQAMAVQEERTPVEEWWGAIQRTLQAAVRALNTARQREGRQLAADLRSQIQAIQRHVASVKRRLPKALEQQRQQLKERVRALVGAATAKAMPRLEEVAALVKEVDIHEELVRIDHHLTHMRQTLAGSDPLGKQLDFIAQELTRETNTMGAKVNDALAARDVVGIKGCIEKIREQVQNLE